MKDSTKKTIALISAIIGISIICSIVIFKTRTRMFWDQILYRDIEWIHAEVIKTLSDQNLCRTHLNALEKPMTDNYHIYFNKSWLKFDMPAHWVWDQRTFIVEPAKIDYKSENFVVFTYSYSITRDVRANGEKLSVARSIPIRVTRNKKKEIISCEVI